MIDEIVDRSDFNIDREDITVCSMKTEGIHTEEGDAEGLLESIVLFETTDDDLSYSTSNSKIM